METIPQTKICRKCGETKPLDCFSPASWSADGRMHQCKPCRSEAGRQWHLAHPEQGKAKARAWRDRNPERAAANRNAWRSANPERAHLLERRKQLQRSYGMTTEQYDAMLAAQGGRCAICGATKNKSARRRYLAVDHDHVTGHTRGLLCDDCNTGIGHLGESIPRLRAAIEYLRKHAPATPLLDRAPARG